MPPSTTTKEETNMAKYGIGATVKIDGGIAKVIGITTDFGETWYELKACGQGTIPFEFEAEESEIESEA